MYLFKPQWNWIKIRGEITAWTDVPHWRRRIMWDYGICGLSVKRQNHSFTVEQRLQIILTTVSFVYSNYFTAAPLMWQGRIDPAAASRMQHSFLFWLSALSPAPCDEGCSPFVALSLSHLLVLPSSSFLSACVSRCSDARCSSLPRSRVLLLVFSASVRSGFKVQRGVFYCISLRSPPSFSSVFFVSCLSDSAESWAHYLFSSSALSLALFIFPSVLHLFSLSLSFTTVW